MRDIITTLLDLVGLLLLAFATAAALFPVLGLAAAGGSAAVLLAGARVIEWVGAPQTAPHWWRRLRGERR
jgi:hypothetical protein